LVSRLVPCQGVTTLCFLFGSPRTPHQLSWRSVPGWVRRRILPEAVLYVRLDVGNLEYPLVVEPDGLGVILMESDTTSGRQVSAVV